MRGVNETKTRRERILCGLDGEIRRLAADWDRVALQILTEDLAERLDRLERLGHVPPDAHEKGRKEDGG
jgi:hypothetical protein